MFDVITAGSATVDVFAHTDKSELITLRSSSGKEEFLAYPSGTKMIINNLSFSIGGGGTNTAVCLSRLGMKTGFIGVLGDDDNGKKILEFLKKENITFLGKKDAKMTGYSIVLDSIGHDRTILTHKGCNDLLSFSDINLRRLNASWFYFSSMMNKSFSTMKKLSYFAEKKGIRICFNPSSYLVSSGFNKLKPILSRTSILVLNKEEATTLLYGDTSANQPVENLLMLLQKTIPVVVITDGDKGAYSFDGDSFYYVKARRIKVIESTGAGDSFASTFLASMIKKEDIPLALKRALINAESVITHHGAKNNLLSFRALSKRLNSSPVKIIIRHHNKSISDYKSLSDYKSVFDYKKAAKKN